MSFNASPALFAETLRWKIAGEGGLWRGLVGEIAGEGRLWRGPVASGQRLGACCDHGVATRKQMGASKFVTAQGATVAGEVNGVCPLGQKYYTMYRHADQLAPMSLHVVAR